ncbi:MAG: HEAT repeat domain-containing protein [bacterium]
MPHSPSPPAISQVEEGVPLDTKRLSQAIIELTIARKNFVIYPAGHIQTTQSVDRAHELLSEILAILPEITVGVARDNLLIGNDYLNKGNPVFKEFSLALSQYEIAGLTISRGMDREELFRFLRVLTKKPEDVRSAGGLNRILSEKGVAHVRIKNIDYSGLHLTEEQRITRPRPLEAQNSNAHVWRDFVANLLENRLAPNEQGFCFHKEDEIDPRELARFINENTLDADEVADCYDRIIARHLTELRGRGRVDGEESETREKFVTLIKELRPELRRQLLSVVFDHYTNKGATGDLLNTFPEDLVLEMIHQANDEGRTISPSLMKLMSKLSAASNRIHENASTGDPSSEVPCEQMKALFEHENHEEYVEAEYESMLSNLVRRQPGARTVEGEGFRIDEHLESLKEDHLDFQIARALLAFMNEDIEEEEYEDFSRTLLTSVEALLQSGRFEFLNDVIMTLLRHGIEKQQKHIQSVAEQSLKHLLKHHFLSKAIAVAKKWEHKKKEEALGFLKNLGPVIVPALIAHYLEKEDKDEEDIILTLLGHFKDTTLSEAKRLMQQTDHLTKKGLALLINRMGEYADVPLLKQMLEHPDEDVSMEALDALLRLKDPWAVIVLRKRLNAKKPETFARAVSLAGKYHVSEAVDDLINGIKQITLFKADHAMNEIIVEALGRIGNPRAIPVLEKLCKGSWPFGAKGTARIKHVVFASLERYPRESVRGLIAIGGRSKDERIKEACRKLLKVG